MHRKRVHERRIVGRVPVLADAEAARGRPAFEDELAGDHVHVVAVLTGPLDAVFGEFLRGVFGDDPRRSDAFRYLALDALVDTLVRTR